MYFYTKTPYIEFDGMEYSFSQQQVKAAEFLYKNKGNFLLYERAYTYCECSDRTFRDSIEKLREFFKDRGYIIRTNRRNSEVGLFEVSK